jgi:hypothetical protein
MKILCLLVSFLHALSVAADELRIEDSHGLTRALKQGVGEVDIVVRLEGQLEGSLQRIDGLTSPLLPFRQQDGSLRFYNVPPGNWKLIADPKTVREVFVVGREPIP